MTTPEIVRTLSDPATSDWLQDTIRVLLRRDPVKAANETEYLAKLMHERADLVLQYARLKNKPHEARL